VERDLTGLPVIYLGTDCTLTGTNSDYALAKSLVTNIRVDEQAGVVIPKPKMGTTDAGQGMLLELLSSPGSKQFDTSTILERYDKRKALSVLAQFIMLGLDKVGSYALSRQQGDLFATTVRAWLNDIASIINSFAVDRLFALNSFPGIDELPQVEPGDVGSVNLADVANYVNRMVQAQVIVPDNELERYLRVLGGLPEPRPADITGGGIGKRIKSARATKQPLAELTEAEAVEIAKRVNQSLVELTEAEVVEVAKQSGADANEHANKLRRKLEVLWAALLARIQRGDLVYDALRDWRVSVEVALEEEYQAAAQASADFDKREWAALFLLVVRPRLERAKDALARFANQLQQELEAAEQGASIGSSDTRGGIAAMLALLARRYSRAMMYAGGVVTIIAAAAMYGKIRKRYIWLAVNDEHTCPDCAEESLKGPRMMHEFTRLPGENVQCMSNCRCELAEV